MKLISFFLFLCILIFSKNTFSEAEYPLMTLVKKLSASSYLPEREKSNMTYHPINVYDENMSTAWISDLNDSEKYLDFLLFSAVDTSYLVIRNGHGESNESFQKYSRIKKIEVTVNNHHKKEFFLQDHNGTQIIPFITSRAKKIRVRVTDTYHGAQHKNVALSEFNISSNLSASNASGIHKDKMNEIYLYSKNREDNSLKIIESIRNMSHEQAEWFLNQNFYKMDGSGERDRAYRISQVLIGEDRLKPILLKAIYSKNNKIINNDIYIHIVNAIWNENIEGIPLVKKAVTNILKKFDYSIEREDTRDIDFYIKSLIKMDYFPDSCCKYMPGKLLSEKGDLYTLKKLEENKHKLVDNSQISSELKFATSSLREKFKGRN